MHKPLTRLLAVTVVVSVLAVGTQSTTSSASRPLATGRHLNLADLGRVARPHPATHVTPAAGNVPDVAGKVWYADTGDGPGGPGKTADAIDVFKGSKLIQSFSEDANQVFEYWGSNTLAHSKRLGCLVLTDSSGYIDSFSLNHDGTVAAEVSHLPDPYGGQPESVLLNKAGTVAVINDPNSSTFLGPYLQSYSIATGCALTFIGSSSGGAGNEFYINSALVGNDVVTGDANFNTIDTYSLSKSGKLSFLKSLPSEVATYVDGMASYRSDVFSGSSNYYGPSNQSVEGGVLSHSGSISFLSGSPTYDPSGDHSTGAVATNGWLFVANNNYADNPSLPASIGSYTTSPSLAFSLDTVLPGSAGSQATPLALVGKTLFVDVDYIGSIEACSIGGSGATNCNVYATLSDILGFSNGLTF
ncbi:MAG TPA: hypothetical protein VKX16_15775 [Chloroflexota bacterium]|nr:hypothetical protein [Chloroflexota bacterium]